MTTKLSLYNGALRVLGQPKLASLTEAAERRYLLDDAYDDNAVNFCLSQGNWNFATRATQRDSNPSITPDFGLEYGFDKPSDWVKTTTITSDEFFKCPLVDGEYVDEQSKWFANIDPIYVRYISSDSAYGGDLSIWTPSFVDYFETYLARKIVKNVHQSSTDFDGVMKMEAKALTRARSNDGANEGIKFMPATGWARARSGWGGRSDRGRRNNLTG